MPTTWFKNKPSFSRPESDINLKPLGSSYSLRESCVFATLTQSFFSVLKTQDPFRNILTSPVAAYPLMKDDLKGFSIKSMEFPPCQSWNHNFLVPKFIELPIKNEYRQSKSLTAFLACLRKSRGGDIRRGTRISTGRHPVDLQHENNGSGVFYQTWGKKEPFTYGKDSSVHLVQHQR